jgi:hypothetical protein
LEQCSDELEFFNAYVDKGLLERLLMFVTGEGNIRDVIAYPRTPGHA